MQNNYGAEYVNLAGDSAAKLLLSSKVHLQGCSVTIK